MLKQNTFTELETMSFLAVKVEQLESQKLI